MRRYKCHVAWPSTGSVTNSPKKYGIAETISSTTMTAAQPIIGTGLVTTARTLVTIAVTKSTSRSSSSGNDTTVSENRISDSAAPSRLPMARNSSPSLVVVTSVTNSLKLENDALSPSRSAIRSRTWYIQITKKNSVTKAIQPISPCDITLDQTAGSEIGRPASRRRLNSYRPVATNGPISAKPAASG